MVQMGNWSLYFLIMPSTHTPEEGAPHRHFLVAVGGEAGLAPSIEVT